MELNTKQKDLLEKFFLHHYEGKFSGTVAVNDGEFLITGKTGDHDTPEECLAEMKNILVKAYAKIDQS